MQQPVRPIPHSPYRFPAAFGAGAIILAAALAPLAGCGDAPAPLAGPPRPFEGQKLTLGCPDPAFAAAVGPMAKAWAARTGAEVALRREPMTPADDTDVGVIPAAHLGEWAEPGLLAAVPLALREGNNPFQWSGLVPAYGERLVEWGGQTVAVPLTGDGFVLVYRADRFADEAVAAEFQKRHNREPAAPATWEEFADLARFFADRDKKPSLPPPPADPERLADLFFRVASSIDREGLNDVRLAARAGRDRDALGFQYSAVTGRPRLTESDGFRLAAEWFARLHAEKALPPDGPDDPVAALAGGRAVLALVSLDQLARLPRENGAVPARFGLAGVPGTRTFVHADQTAATPDPNVNYVPHFAGGRLGVVRTRCPHQEAAFDLLAELGGPARGAELIATPGLGAGPTRTAHLERERLTAWLGYGFDEARSKALQDALRHYLEPAVRNPTLGLRGPDRGALVAATAAAVRRVAAGAVPPAAGLKEAEAAWQAHDAKVPPDVLLRWRQRGVGLH